MDFGTYYGNFIDPILSNEIFNKHFGDLELSDEQRADVQQFIWKCSRETPDILEEELNKLHDSIVAVNSKRVKYEHARQLNNLSNDDDLGIGK